MGDDVEGEQEATKETLKDHWLFLVSNMKMANQSCTRSQRLMIPIN